VNEKRRIEVEGEALRATFEAEQRRLQNDLENLRLGFKADRKRLAKKLRAAEQEIARVLQEEAEAEEMRKKADDQRKLHEAEAAKVEKLQDLLTNLHFTPPEHALELKLKRLAEDAEILRAVEAKEQERLRIAKEIEKIRHSEAEIEYRIVDEVKLPNGISKKNQISGPTVISGLRLTETPFLTEQEKNELLKLSVNTFGEEFLDEQTLEERQRADFEAEIIKLAAIETEKKRIKDINQYLEGLLSDRPTFVVRPQPPEMVEDDVMPGKLLALPAVAIAEDVWHRGMSPGTIFQKIRNRDVWILIKFILF